MLAIFPQLIAIAEKSEPESLAILVRQYFAGADATRPSVVMDELLEDMGIAVKEDVRATHLAATLVEDRHGAFAVSFVIQPELVGHERQFLLAHMLGHYLFHIQGPLAAGELRHFGFVETISPLLRFEHPYDDGLVQDPASQIEAEADGFAACLLMPKAMFLKAYATLSGPEQVAQFFGVSDGCVARRYQHLYAPPPKPKDLPPRQDQPPVRAAAKPAAQAADVAPRPRKGMARLRELAAQLDTAAKPLRKD